MSGVYWGRAEELGTVAFWYTQAHWAALSGDTAVHGPHALGRTLEEEVAACVLGGYGIPANVGLAAFDAVCADGLLDQRTDVEQPSFEESLRATLPRPLCMDGRSVRYRFAAQRARRLAAALAVLARESPSDALSDVAFRD